MRTRKTLSRGVRFAVWWNYLSDLILNVALELLYIHKEDVRQQEVGGPGNKNGFR